jgi:hypothetical protein
MKLLKYLEQERLNEESVSINDFRNLSEDKRVKLLWQWATAKQKTLQEWKDYLTAHCESR